MSSTRTRNNGAAVTGPVATPEVETIEMIEAKAAKLEPFGSVQKVLAWASSIRLSGRGMRDPAERRRLRPEAHPALRYLRRAMTALVALVIAAPIAVSAADEWPGAPPDCWAEPRLIHSVQDLGDLWQKNTKIATRKARKPPSGEISPNKGYVFVMEGGRPNGRVTIYAEKAHLVDIQFINLFGLSDVRWLNEKLILMRPWWSRIAATDLIFDVEREKIIYAEPVTDGTLAHQQYLESCPIHGCECIKKE